VHFKSIASHVVIKVFKAVRRGKARRWGAAQSPRRAKASLKQGDGEPPCRLGDALKTLVVIIINNNMEVQRKHKLIT